MNTGTRVETLMIGTLSAAADPSQRRRDLLGALGLMWAMVLTRADQSGTHPLPDASLAVFFLLGLFNRSALWLPVALILAAAVDAWVVSGDVSALCTTPASLFLIPTYATMWLAGRLTRRRRPTPPFSGSAVLRDSIALLTTAGVAAGVAFLISSGSFYFLSGQFPDLPLSEYSRLVLIRYLPPYVAYCLVYVAATLVISYAAIRPRLAGVARPREPAA
jgi:hypothetical protein